MLGDVAPPLAPSAARLSLNKSGRTAGQAWRTLGRQQVSRGTDVWDEWFVVFSDGRTGWVAEAEGMLWITAEVAKAGALPAHPTLRHGQRLTVQGAGELTVEDLGEARVLSGEGELPFPLQVGARYAFADAKGAEQRCATLHYEADHTARVFVGHMLRYADAGLGSLAAPALPLRNSRASWSRDCPSCSAAVSLRSEKARAYVCSACGALCDVEDGRLSLSARLPKRPAPALPIGSRGKLDGRNVEVVGCLERKTVHESVAYSWREYLLYSGDAKSELWLSESNGHWAVQTPLRAPLRGADLGRVLETGGVRVGDRTFRHFEHSAFVRCDGVHGEFPFPVRLEARVAMDDYVAPPFIASVEYEDGEAHWTQGHYLGAHEVWRAFELSGQPPARIGRSPCEPNPHAESRWQAAWSAAAAAAALLLMALTLQLSLPRTVVAHVDAELDAAANSGVISEPFEISGGTHALEIVASAPHLTNAWIGVDVALIDVDNQEADWIGIELARYEGVEGGRPWSEGSRVGSEMIGSVAPGHYRLRIDAISGQEPGASLPARIVVQATHGVFRWTPFFLALVLLASWPLLLQLRAHLFEKQRWARSDHPFE